VADGFEDSAYGACVVAAVVKFSERVVVLFVAWFDLDFV